MKRNAALGLFAVATVAVCAQTAATYDRTVERRYEDNSGVLIEGAGACHVTEDSISCWDMDGNPAAGLADKMRGQLASSNGSEVGFKFGQKNRYLVVRKTVPNGLSVNYSLLTGSYVNVLNGSYSQGEPATEYVRVSTDRDQKSTGLVATIFGIPGPKSIDLAFRTGEAATYDGHSITIGSIEPVKDPDEMFQGSYFYNYYSGYPSNGVSLRGHKAWTVVLGVSASQVGPGPTLVPVGKDGKPILHVDRNGEVVSDMEFLHEQQLHPTNQPPSMRWGDRSRGAKYDSAVFSTYGGQPTPTAQLYATNINPADIAALRISSTHQFRVAITGFPLDPK